MIDRNTQPLHPRAMRGEKLRQHVLDEAEHLLRKGDTDFSMRDLAAAAGVSFATPFNQFGGKAAIMQALSMRRIDRMEALYDQAARLPDAASRVLYAIDLAAAVMLEEPAVNRALMGCLGAASPSPGQTLQRSKALWAKALDRLDEPAAHLAQRLAFGFRGALSFWAAGELSDEALRPVLRDMATGLLRGAGDLSD